MEHDEQTERAADQTGNNASARAEEINRITAAHRAIEENEWRRGRQNLLTFFPTPKKSKGGEIIMAGAKMPKMKGGAGAESTPKMPRHAPKHPAVGPAAQKRGGSLGGVPAGARVTGSAGTY